MYEARQNKEKVSRTLSQQNQKIVQQHSSDVTFNRRNKSIFTVNENVIQCWNPFQSLFSYRQNEISQLIVGFNQKWSADQKKVTQYILLHVGERAFHGGHYYKETGGLYSRWNKLLSAKKRGSWWPIGLPSSHYPQKETPQYELQLPNNWFDTNWGTVLFGIRKGNKNKRDTWFQIEGHSGVMGEGINGKVRFVTDLILHGVDYVKHRITENNIGPLGTDYRTEKKGTEKKIG